jgi:hypothetical protein
MAAESAALEDDILGGSDDDTEFGEEEHPAEVADADTPPTYGKNNRDLPEQLKNVMAALAKTFQNRDMYDRRIEVLMDRCMRFYDDGVQHFYPNYGTGVYQVGAAGAVIDLGNGDQMECPDYMGAYNIFRTARRTIDGPLTQNPPGVDFEPIRPGEPEDIQSAEIAEGYRHYFDQNNDRPGKQQEISRMMELSGRVVTWTHSSRNKQRWGENEKGEPRQMETVEVFGTLESKVPIVCKEFEKMLYCFLYLDPDVLVAKSENSWIRDKIVAGQPGLGESDWERYARLGVRQSRKGYYLTGEALTHLVTEMHLFMRPAAFEDKVCDNPWVEGDEPQLTEDGKQMTLRDKLRELYPEGCHVKYMGQEYSESWAEAMDDAIDIGFPTKRDGMTGGALMEPGKVIQDTFNDYKNAERENYEKGWPVTYFRGDVEDYDAIRNQRSTPKSYVLLKEGDPANPVEDMFHTEEGFDVPASFVEAMEACKQLIKEVIGALDALQGSSKADQTASGQAMDRAQAMGVLGPAWANIQKMWAGIYQKAAILAAKNPDHAKEIAVPGKDGKKITFHLQKLKKGTFRCKPDQDSSFPESTASQRANMQGLLPMAAKSPVGATLFESPDNWEEILRLNGNPNLVLTPAIAYKKQTRELEILLGEPPAANPDFATYNQQHATQTLTAEAQGLPAPPYQPPPAQLPSLMPEADDYHKWESAKCQEYLSSEDCWIRQNIGDPQAVLVAQAGVLNVRLHKGVHDQFLAQQAAAAAQAAQQIKPPSESINFKDESPGGRAAMEAQAGIHVAAAPEAAAGVQKNAAAPGSPGTATT